MHVFFSDFRLDFSLSFFLSTLKELSPQTVDKFITNRKLFGNCFETLSDLVVVLVAVAGCHPMQDI